MIKLARRRKIDLILCKSISRFARNTVDCLDYVRELRSLGVTVIFEKENINTSSMSSEFAISLYASFAQAESESISKNVTWGIEKSFREGNVTYRFDKMLGYRLDENKRPYIIEEEAETVRFIFKEYADGRCSADIARDLTALGAKRRNGSTQWTRNHVYQILKNEKYAGDAILQKTFTVNCITHDRRKNTGQKPMYYVRDCHDAIIDRRTYDTVRLELEKRKRSKKRGQPAQIGATKYSLSRLLFCPYCGGNYKRTVWLEKQGKIGVWRCKNRMEGKKCPRSSSYHEDALEKAVLAAVNKAVENVSCFQNADTGSTLLLAEDREKTERLIIEANEKLAVLEAQRDKILGSISGSLFDGMGEELKEINRREVLCAEELEKLRNHLDENKRRSLCEQSARELLRSLTKQKSFDNELSGRIISRIDAVSRHELEFTFYGGFTVVQKL